MTAEVREAPTAAAGPEVAAAWRIGRLRVRDLEAFDAIQRDGLPDAYSVEGLLEELRRPRAHNLGAFDAAGALLGGALTWLVAGELQILQVVVAEAARRRGVGRGLVEALLDGARAAGATVATLEVRRGNAGAQALYLRCGFAIDGLRRRYYADGEDAVLMSRPLGAEAER